MSVFSNYNPKLAGQVLQQAKPKVVSFPWIAPRYTLRTDRQWGGNGRVMRVQPQERTGAFLLKRSIVGSAAVASISTTPQKGVGPRMGSGCGGACGGGCGGCK